jgi:hypothetical protein
MLLVAVRAWAKRLFLYHHDPDHTMKKSRRWSSVPRGLVGQKRRKPIVAAARAGDALLLGR